MPQPQKGICAEPNLHALYLMFNVIDEQDDVIREKLAKILDVFEHYDEEHYEAMISGVVAIGSNYWMELYPCELPLELAPFPICPMKIVMPLLSPVICTFRSALTGQIFVMRSV